jgi:hypothetical protein
MAMVFITPHPSIFPLPNANGLMARINIMVRIDNLVRHLLNLSFNHLLHRRGLSGFIPRTRDRVKGSLAPIKCP